MPKIIALGIVVAMTAVPGTSPSWRAFFCMDAMAGKGFEAGLANLKSAAQF